jgi:hypothetical protein
MGMKPGEAYQKIIDESAGPSTPAAATKPDGTKDYGYLWK